MSLGSSSNKQSLESSNFKRERPLNPGSGSISIKKSDRAPLHSFTPPLQGTSLASALNLADQGSQELEYLRRASMVDQSGSSDFESVGASNRDSQTARNTNWNASVRSRKAKGKGALGSSESLFASKRSQREAVLGGSKSLSANKNFLNQSISSTDSSLSSSSSGHDSSNSTSMLQSPSFDPRARSKDKFEQSMTYWGKSTASGKDLAMSSPYIIPSVNYSLVTAAANPPRQSLASKAASAAYLQESLTDDQGESLKAFGERMAQESSFSDGTGGFSRSNRSAFGKSIQADKSYASSFGNSKVKSLDSSGSSYRQRLGDSDGVYGRDTQPSFSSNAPKRRSREEIKSSLKQPGNSGSLQKSIRFDSGRNLEYSSSTDPASLVGDEDSIFNEILVFCLDRADHNFRSKYSIKMNRVEFFTESQPFRLIGLCSPRPANASYSD